MDKTKTPVTIAHLQAAVILPGGRTETTLSKDKVPHLEMFWLKGEGLLVRIKTQAALIPTTNVKVIHLETSD